LLPDRDFRLQPVRFSSFVVSHQHNKICRKIILFSGSPGNYSGGISSTCNFQKGIKKTSVS
jgi:hypothetical protein